MRVLAATDGSEAGDEAILQAHRWALPRRAALVVCHVLPNRLAGHPLFPQALPREALAQSHVEADIVAVLDHRVASLTGRAGGDYLIVVDEGSPDAAIERVAERSAAALVVVGPDRDGTIVERLVRAPRRPVLVARPHLRTAHLLVASDLRPRAFAPVAAAAEQARIGGARLTLLHCLDRVLDDAEAEAMFGSDDDFVPDRVEAARSVARAQAQDWLERFRSDGRCVVTCAPPLHAIVAAAVELDVDLVIVGARSRCALGRLGQRRISDEVVRRSPCSVLVVPETS